MMRRRRNVWMVCLVALALSLSACTEDNGTGSSNNGWDVGQGNDGGGPDAGDTTSGPDTSPDGSVPDAIGDATVVDAGQTTPFTPEGLASKPWYGVTPLTSDPAVTGSMFKVDFHADMTVTVGFRGEVSGKWEIFGDDRLRLFELEQADGQPNEPTQLVLDADLSGDNLDGLELLIPRQNQPPYLLRFEQLGDADVTVDDLDGKWQSDDTFPGENGDMYWLVVRVMGDYAGYGFYNGGAYVEFAGGDAHTITYDSGETFWFYEPPTTGDPKPALCGELVVDAAGEMTLYAPRQSNPGQTPEEFEAVAMHPVDALGD